MMHGEADLLSILEAVTTAGAVVPEPLSPEQRSIFYIPEPRLRRVMNLRHNGRAERMDALAGTIAARTDTPDWLARMALDAALPVDHETELDDEVGRARVLRRAIRIMDLGSAIPPGSPTPAAA